MDLRYYKGIVGLQKRNSCINTSLTVQMIVIDRYVLTRTLLLM